MVEVEREGGDGVGVEEEGDGEWRRGRWGRLNGKMEKG